VQKPDRNTLAAPQRPTIRDIARVARVSLATVDRVLNERPGVRHATVQRVHAAIADLGYVRDLAAANLARQREYRLRFFLPDGNSEFLAALRTEILQAVRNASLHQRTALQIQFFPAEDPWALAGMLDALESAQTDGIAIMAAETPPARDALRRLHARGIPVVTLISDLPSTHRQRFVGIDNCSAGRTAAVLMGRFLGPRGGKVLVYANSMLLRESIERRLGFDEVLSRDFPQIEALQSIEGHGDPETTRQALANVLAAEPELAGIYSLGTGNRALSAALEAYPQDQGRIVIVHELTPHTRAALQAGRITAVINQNLVHVVRSALRILRAILDGSPIDPAQEEIRIEILIRENLPTEHAAGGESVPSSTDLPGLRSADLPTRLAPDPTPPTGPVPDPDPDPDSEPRF
jgi:LacI family transcriptional regulator